MPRTPKYVLHGFMRCRAAHRLMLRRPWPLAVAGTTGGLSGLVLSLLREASLGDSPLLTSADSCPLPSLVEDPPAWRIEPSSLLLGILIGVLLEPLIDLAFLLRVSAFRVTRRRLGGHSGWYRLLDERD